MRRSGRAHLRAGPASRLPRDFVTAPRGPTPAARSAFLPPPPQGPAPSQPWGRLSRYGVFELAATLDHIGPMARSAVDCGAILGAIAGSDPNDPTAVLEPVPNYLADLSGSLRGTRIGVDPRWTSEGVDAAATRIFQDALRVAADLGAEILEIVVPDPTAMIDDWFRLWAVETAVAHEATYPSRKS